MKQLLLLAALIAFLMTIGCGAFSELIVPPTPTPTPTMTPRPTFTPTATSTATITPKLTFTPTPTLTADPEVEYYRGLYDSCAELTGDPLGCLKAVGRAYKNNWFEQPSPGWIWPLPIGNETDQTS